MPDPSLNYTALAMADPLNQNITLTMPDGFQMLISLSEIDSNNSYAISNTIGYAVEFGASLVMLFVLLAMTPKSKFWRLASYINMASLINNMVRTILLAIYFDSSWTRFYVLYGGDISYISETDFRNSIAAVVFNMLQNFLMMAALMLQAWAMVKLWERNYKWGILVFSGLLSLTEVAFVLAAQGHQIRSFYPGYSQYDYLHKLLYLRYVYLALELTCICWFCFLFVLRLVSHMIKHRSFLPSTKGVSAMDMLVMTNGVLMLVPVILIAMQVSEKFPIETGSYVYTSVAIVLPLGTMIAQRLSDPGAFNSSEGRSGTGSNNHNSGAGSHDFASSGRKPLIHSWSGDRNTGSMSSGRRGSKAIQEKTGLVSSISSDRPQKGGPDALDLELAQIDGDLESGRVRVNRELQQSEEML